MRSCLLLPLLLCACPQDRPRGEPPAPAKATAPAAPQPVPTSPPTQAVAAESRQGGAPGSIQGVVSLVGPVPPPQALKVGADPVCRKGQPLDEAVLVADGKLANALVRIVEGAPASPAPASPVVLDQEGCVFRPRVQGALRGQSLAVKNSDGTLHNVHTYLGKRTWFNLAQPPKAPDLVRPMDEHGVVRVRCDVHPWMVAFIVVSEHGHFALTGADGRFELPAVPPGRYVVEVWHERFGVKRQEVVVEPGKPAALDLSYQASDRS